MNIMKIKNIYTTRKWWNTTLSNSSKIQ